VTTEDEKTIEPGTEKVSESGATVANADGTETEAAAVSTVQRPVPAPEDNPKAGIVVVDEVAHAPDHDPETVAQKLEAGIAGEDYAPTVAGAAAHLFGISRPQDEYGTRSIDRDVMSDDDLLAMGVEPDAGPGAKITLTFVAMTVVLLLTGIATAALFGWVNDIKGEAISDRVHPQLVDARENAAEVLNAYAELDDGNYRVPIATGMDILVGSPSLLAGLSDSPSTDPAEPSAEGYYVVPTAAAAVPSPSGLNPANRIGQPQVQPGQNVGIAVPTGAVPVAVDPHLGNDHPADNAGHEHAAPDGSGAHEGNDH
jgi:hypothetical protein